MLPAKWSKQTKQFFGLQLVCNLYDLGLDRKEILTFCEGFAYYFSHLPKMQWVTLLFGVACLIYLGSASLLVLDCPVSLYHEDSRLSTLLWLRPAYCLYEEWTRKAIDPSQATRWTATIEVEVKPAGSNSTYKIGRRFPVPHCSPMMEDPFVLEEGLAYEMGPTLICFNESCTKAVLPGHGYSVRYVLYNQAQSLLAATNWSQPFQTRGEVGGGGGSSMHPPLSFRSIDVEFKGASGGLVIIIVLLSITVFVLLGAAWSAMGSRNHHL
ncbi:uncharacterized protein LOC110078538 isoform X2 [Pogona vitticeps]